MFETACASVRFGVSMAFGRPFHLKSLNRIIEALQESIDEYGPATLGATGVLLAAPMLDGRTRAAVQGRRLRTQAVRAAERTPYYERLFRRIDVDARRLGLSDALEVPITGKSLLRSNPDAFVCRNSRADVRVTTTGTTGWPASICFSQRELQVIGALSALGLLSRQLIQPDDIVHVATNPRALLGISGVSRASTAIGAPIHIAGLPGAAVTLALLAEQRRLTGKNHG
jgi:phenylacetate-CoA ligase